MQDITPYINVVKQILIPSIEAQQGWKIVPPDAITGIAEVTQKNGSETLMSFHIQPANKSYETMTFDAEPYNNGYRGPPLMLKAYLQPVGEDYRLLDWAITVTSEIEKYITSRRPTPTVNTYGAPFYVVPWRDIEVRRMADPGRKPYSSGKHPGTPKPNNDALIKRISDAKMLTPGDILEGKTNLDPQVRTAYARRIARETEVDALDMFSD